MRLFIGDRHQIEHCLRGLGNVAKLERQLLDEIRDRQESQDSLLSTLTNLEATNRIVMNLVSSQRISSFTNAFVEFGEKVRQQAKRGQSRLKDRLRAVPGVTHGGGTNVVFLPVLEAALFRPLADSTPRDSQVLTDFRDLERQALLYDNFFLPLTNGVGSLDRESKRMVEWRLEAYQRAIDRLEVIPLRRGDLILKDEGQLEKLSKEALQTWAQSPTLGFSSIPNRDGVFDPSVLASFYQCRVLEEAVKVWEKYCAKVLAEDRFKLKVSNEKEPIVMIKEALRLSNDLDALLKGWGQVKVAASTLNPRDKSAAENGEAAIEQKRKSVRDALVNEFKEERNQHLSRFPLADSVDPTSQVMEEREVRDAWDRLNAWRSDYRAIELDPLHGPSMLRLFGDAVGMKQPVEDALKKFGFVIEEARVGGQLDRFIRQYQIGFPTRDQLALVLGGGGGGQQVVDALKTAGRLRWCDFGVFAGDPSDTSDKPRWSQRFSASTRMSVQLATGPAGDKFSPANPPKAKRWSVMELLADPNCQRVEAESTWLYPFTIPTERGGGKIWVMVRPYEPERR